MIGTNQYDLTWSHFAQLHADKEKVFENLSRSLFLRELCCAGTILHSDPNHPGIETAPALAKDGQTKIGFQAKYFANAIGYEQIRKSVEKAVKYYAGKLDLLYLYCNQDITRNCDSYRAITQILDSARIKIELVTGQAILDQAMNFPPVLSCYFGLDSLDDNWFKRNVDLSIENLGRRYNQLFNVDTEAQRNISLFLKEPAGIVEINAKKQNLISVLKNLRWRCDGKYNNEVTGLLKWVKSLADVDAKSVLSSLMWKDRFNNECKKIFTEFENKLNQVRSEIENYTCNNLEYKKLRDEEFIIERIISVAGYLEFSSIESNMLNCNTAIVTGKMGTGKSQLLATAAKRMVDQGRLALLILGQMLISDDSIETQIMQNLEGLNPGQNFESIVSVMDERGALIGEDAVIFVDAINESKNRDSWKNGINRIIATLKRYTHVKMVLSVRKGFEELTLSQGLLNKIKSGQVAVIEHTGLADESPGRIYEFLSYYGITFSPEYYLHSEMTNPLFLTWFCDTYNGEEPGLLCILDKVMEKADLEGAKGAGLSEKTGMLKPLLYEMLDTSTTGNITKRVLCGLSVWNIYGVTNKMGYLNAIERSGVLASFVHEREENYYIGYNLLSDYLKAARIIDKEIDKKEIIEFCKKKLLGIDDAGNMNKHGNETVFTMVASLYS